MPNRSFVSHLTGVLVEIMFYGGIACCIAVPFIAEKVAVYLGYTESSLLPTELVVISTGLAAVYMMWQLKKIFKTLSGGNPFVVQNVDALRRISVAGAVISVVYFVRCFFLFTITTGLLALIFAVATLFCLTLKDVFKQAVWYKEENDLTV